LANAVANYQNDKAGADQMGTPAVRKASDDHEIQLGKEEPKTPSELARGQAMSEKAAAEQQAKATRNALGLSH
jgi:hypothetical protein